MSSLIPFLKTPESATRGQLELMCLQAAYQIDRYEEVLRKSSAVLVGPCDSYEGCQEMLDEIRDTLEFFND